MGVLGAPLRPYTLLVRYETVIGTCTVCLYKMVWLLVLSVLAMGSLYTNSAEYEFLKLYGACLQRPGRKYPIKGRQRFWSQI